MRMRLKNFTLLVLMGLFGLFTTNLFAQEDASIDPANIRYWIGEGDNEVIFIANWNNPDTALAWGYRFNGNTLMVKDVMDAVAETDTRFDYTASGSIISNLTFNDGVLDLALVGGWWMYNVNGITAGNYFDAQPVVNGDVIKVGDESCGIITDFELWTYVWTKEVAAVYPLAEEATIDPSEILCWIGEGENELVFAVNWNNPDTCLAWGYRFSTPAVQVKEVMDAIAEKDGRFAYVPGDWGVADITYNSGALHLALAGMYWLFNVNGIMAPYGYDAMPVQNGDFIKWGDESCATEIAQWTYVWDTPVIPVANNTAVSEGASELSVYPNPAVSFAMVDLAGQAGTVVVSDLQGRVLDVVQVSAGSQAIRLETASYEAGIYLVSMRRDGDVKTVKLIVQ